MAITILPTKKYCPFCYWTMKTDKSTCPKVGDFPLVHEYRINVPLETCKDDTSNFYKEIRSRHQDIHKTVAKNYKRRLPGKVRIDINLIRMMQRRAREIGIIKEPLQS